MLSTDQKIYWAIKRLVWKIKIFLTYDIIRNIKKLKYYKYIFRLPEVLIMCRDVIETQTLIIKDKNKFIDNIKLGSYDLLQKGIDEAITRATSEDWEDWQQGICEELGNKYKMEYIKLFWYGDHKKYSGEEGWEEAWEDYRDSSFLGPDYPYHIDELVEDTIELKRLGVIDCTMGKEVF